MAKMHQLALAALVFCTGSGWASEAALLEDRPVARIKESVVCCPSDTIVLDGWASIDLGGEVVQWQWDIDGDGRIDRTSDIGEVRFAASSQPRTFGVTLCVKDNQGNLSLPDSATVCIMNSQPQVSIRPDTMLKVGTRLFLDPKVTLPCGDIVKYEWDLDDDGTWEYMSKTDGKTSKVFYKPGRYRLRFRVTDSQDRQGGAVGYVTVSGTAPRH